MLSQRITSSTPWCSKNNARAAKKSSLAASIVRPNRHRCKAQETEPFRAPPPPPPPPPPPAPPSSPWWKPRRRDFIVAGIGSLIGGGVMYVNDTAIINDLYDEMEDLEDEMAFIEEQEMLNNQTRTMEDLQAQDARQQQMPPK